MTSKRAKSAPASRRKSRHVVDDRVGTTEQALQTLKAAIENQKLSLPELRKEAQKDGNAYKTARKKSSDLKYEALTSTYRLYIFAETHNMTAELLEQYRCEGLKIYSRHPLNSILRFNVTGSRDVASRWARALVFAISNAVGPDDLTHFIKKNGGIDRCSRQHATEMRKQHSAAANERETGGFPLKPYDHPAPSKVTSKGRREIFVSESCEKTLVRLQETGRTGAVIVRAYLQKSGRIILLAGRPHRNNPHLGALAAGATVLKRLTPGVPSGN